MPTYTAKHCFGAVSGKVNRKVRQMDSSNFIWKQSIFTIGGQQGIVHSLTGPVAYGENLHGTWKQNSVDGRYKQSWQETRCGDASHLSEVSWALEEGLP